jgi:Rrf2 family iron-sulfur cluster assembly transcriptional regulator
MDLTLSKRGDYVVRAAIALAAAWDQGGFRTIAEVAEEMELPRSFTPQVLGDLARAGLAESKAGRRGGYRLARAPGKILMLEVVEAAEGSLVSQRCPIRDGPCRWDDVCAVHPTWLKASEAIRRVLARTTLAAIASTDRDLAMGRRVAPMPPPGHRRRRGS